MEREMDACTFQNVDFAGLSKCYTFLHEALLFSGPKEKETRSLVRPEPDCI